MKATPYNVLKFTIITKALELKAFTYYELVDNCPACDNDTVSSDFAMAFNSLVDSNAIGFDRIDRHGKVEFSLRNLSVCAEIMTELVAENPRDFHIGLAESITNKTFY